WPAGTASTRTGTRRPPSTPGTCSTADDHSSVVYRDRSKYAAENSATTFSHRSSASLMAVTQFRPAAHSHTSSSTRYPAPASCQATHSAHARMADKEINPVPAHTTSIRTETTNDGRQQASQAAIQLTPVECHRASAEVTD